jgi:hypothetical protein
VSEGSSRQVDADDPLAGEESQERAVAVSAVACPERLSRTICAVLDAQRT